MVIMSNKITAYNISAGGGLERRLAVVALAGVLLCGSGLVLPANVPASDAHPAAKAEGAKAHPVEIRPETPVPSAPSPSPTNDAPAGNPASPEDPAAGAAHPAPPVP